MMLTNLPAFTAIYGSSEDEKYSSNITTLLIRKFDDVSSRFEGTWPKFNSGIQFLP